MNKNITPSNDNKDGLWESYDDNGKVEVKEYYI